MSLRKEPQGKADGPDVCRDTNHDISRHFQYIRGRDQAEAVCRCYTCGREWQEFYDYDYSDEFKPPTPESTTKV